MVEKSKDQTAGTPARTQFSHYKNTNSTEVRRLCTMVLDDSLVGSYIKTRVGEK